MFNNFSIKSVFEFNSQVNELDHGEERVKARIWICPDCGKLYLTVFPRRRQGNNCMCGHLFDERDAG